MFDLLKRQIAVGFLYSLTLDERKKIIDSGISENEFYRLYGRKVKESDVFSVINWLDKTDGAYIWSYNDPDYPINDTFGTVLPYNLFCLGKRSLSKNIAIIGSRHVNYNALKKSFCLGLETNCNSLRVISGIAEGCDQAALSGSIEAAKKGMGIAGISVLAHGFLIDYPSNSNGFKTSLLDNNGLLISQFPPYMPPLKYNFLYRNFLIGALCNSLINVQSGKKSGANITLNLTLDMGKDVYVADVGCADNEICLGSRGFYLEGCKQISNISDVYKNASYRCKEENIFIMSANSNNYFRFGNSLYSIEKIINNCNN